MASQQSQNTPRHAPKILKRIPPGYEQQRRSRRNQVPQQACEVPAQKQTAAAQPAPVQQCPAPQMQQRQGFSPIVANSQLTGYWRKEGGTRVFVHQAPPKEQPQQTTSAPHTQPTSAGTHASSSATQAKATPVVTTAPFKFRADAPAYVPATQMPAAVERTEGQAAVCAGEQAAAAVCAIDTAAAQTAAHKQPEQAAAEAAGADTAGAEQPEQAAAGLAAVEQASIEMSTADETAAAEPAAMDTAATDTGAAGQPEKATVEMTGAETAAAETTEGQLVSVNIFVRVFGSLTVTLRVADVLGATKDECSEAQASNEQQEQGISSEAQASNDQTGDSTAKADAYSSDKGADIAKLEMMFASAPDSPRIPAVMSGSVASHDSVDGALPFVMVSRRGTREDAPVASQDAPEVIKPRETEVETSPPLDEFGDVPVVWPVTEAPLVRVFKTPADRLFADGVRLHFKSHTGTLSSQGHVHSCSGLGGMTQTEIDQETALKQRLLMDRAGSTSCVESPVCHVTKVATKAGFVPDCVTEAAACYMRGLGRFVRKLPFF